MRMAIVEGGAFDVKVAGIKELRILDQKRIATSVHNIRGRFLACRLEVLQCEPQSLLPVKYARERLFSNKEKSIFLALILI